MGLFTAGLSRSSGREYRDEDRARMQHPTHEDLQEWLHKGVVTFKYLKKDGETVREAVGTMKRDLIAKAHGGECPPKRVGYTVYFDLDKDAYRVFLDENVIEVTDIDYSE